MGNNIQKTKALLKENSIFAKVIKTLSTLHAKSIRNAKLLHTKYYLVNSIYLNSLLTLLKNASNCEIL